MTVATARAGRRAAASLLVVPASEPDDVQVVPVVPVTSAASAMPGASLPAPDVSRVPAAAWSPAAAPEPTVASRLILKASAARSTRVGSRRRRQTRVRRRSYTGPLRAL
jgi:hypothetical protein